MGSVNLEQQIINLPHVLEFSFLDSHNSPVVVDCSGYLLQHGMKERIRIARKDQEKEEERGGREESR